MKPTLWQKYGAHYIAYAIGVLTFILSYVHGCGAPQSATAVRLLTGAGMVLAGLHQFQTFLRTPEPLPAPAPSTRGKEMGRASLGALGFLVALTATLAACASLTSAMGTAASASAVQAAIDLAVGTTLQATAHTPGAQAAKAAQIVTITQEVEGAFTGNTTTLAALDATLQQAILAANLPPPDKAAAVILAQTVQSIILQQIQGAPGSKPVLTASQTIAVKTVLNDVIQAASFYDVHAMAAMRADMAMNPAGRWRSFSRAAAAAAKAAALRADAETSP